MCVIIIFLQENAQFPRRPVLFLKKNNDCFRHQHAAEIPILVLRLYALNRSYSKNYSIKRRKRSSCKSLLRDFPKSIQKRKQENNSLFANQEQKNHDNSKIFITDDRTIKPEEETNKTGARVSSVTCVFVCLRVKHAL